MKVRGKVHFVIPVELEVPEFDDPAFNYEPAEIEEMLLAQGENTLAEGLKEYEYYVTDMDIPGYVAVVAPQSTGEDED